MPTLRERGGSLGVLGKSVNTNCRARLASYPGDRRLFLRKSLRRLKESARRTPLFDRFDLDFRRTAGAPADKGGFGRIQVRPHISATALHHHAHKGPRSHFGGRFVHWAGVLAGRDFCHNSSLGMRGEGGGILRLLLAAGDRSDSSALRPPPFSLRPFRERVGNLEFPPRFSQNAAYSCPEWKLCRLNSPKS